MTFKPSTAERTGDGRSYYRITIKQCCAEHPKHHNDICVSLPAALRQGHQRECAPFALIVGTQQENHVFKVTMSSVPKGLAR